MITLCRDEQRHHARHGQQQTRQTFHRECGADQCRNGFAALETLNEQLIPPGAVARHLSRHNAQVLTCVHAGALAFDDATGGSGVIQAGEVQCRIALRGTRHSETNDSRTNWAHVYQFGLRMSDEEFLPRHEEKRFSAAERRGELRVMASPDARGGSLLVQLDALLFSAILDPGRHLVHELAAGRGVWLHVVKGRIKLGDIDLAAGDGAGIEAERAVSLTAEDESEILLLDLCQPLPSASQEAGNGERG